MSFSSAPNLVKRVNQELENERKNRIKFRNELKEHQKAEFINGEVVMQSPVKNIHAIFSGNLMTLLSLYSNFKNFGNVYHEKVLCAVGRNNYEPDICFFRKEVADTFEDNQMIFPVPDFVVEVLSPSTEKIDRGVNFRDYEAHGVNEYWIVDPQNKKLEHYILMGDQFQKSKNSEIIKSNVLEGLKLPIKAIFDKTENLDFLKTIIS